MGVPEYLVIIGLVAGFAKFQIDLAARLDDRIDKLESEILSLKHNVDKYHNESFFNLEVIESRLNMMLSTQEAFMEKVVCRYEKMEEMRKD